MNQPHCTICHNIFDCLHHRPRALPCGHGFCTQCIDACIRNEDRSCPICRVVHGKYSATDLPVSFLLEDLLDKSSSSPQYESDEELEKYESDEEACLDMCPKHKKVPLHFLCKTHRMKVCHSCTVIDHAPPSCILMSLDSLVGEKKQSQIDAVRRQKKNIMMAEKDLTDLFQRIILGVTKLNNKKSDLQKEVDLLLAKIGDIDKEVSVMQESEEKIKGAIQNCQIKQQECEIIENKLKDTKYTRAIKEEIHNAAEELVILRGWEEDLRNAHALGKDKYAKFERNGIVRSSKVLFEGAKTLIPSLSKEITPPIFAELIQIPQTFKEADVYMISATTTVFMDLSVRDGKERGRDLNLGRIEVKILTDRPIGKQFVMLVLGTDGISYKGANFEWKDSHSVGLQNYLTEDNTKAEVPLLETKENEYKETQARGRIFMAGINRTGFVIRTKHIPSDQYGHIGDVKVGMDAIDRVVSNEFEITQIFIRNCGLVVYEAAGFSCSKQNQNMFDDESLIF